MMHLTEMIFALQAGTPQPQEGTGAQSGGGGVSPIIWVVAIVVIVLVTIYRVRRERAAREERARELAERRALRDKDKNA